MSPDLAMATGSGLVPGAKGDVTIAFEGEGGIFDGEETDDVAAVSREGR
jgi:hypothetical protein